MPLLKNAIVIASKILWIFVCIKNNECFASECLASQESARVPKLQCVVASSPCAGGVVLYPTVCCLSITSQQQYSILEC